MAVSVCLDKIHILYYSHRVKCWFIMGHSRQWVNFPTCTSGNAGFPNVSYTFCYTGKMFNLGPVLTYPLGNPGRWRGAWCQVVATGVRKHSACFSASRIYFFGGSAWHHRVWHLVCLSIRTSLVDIWRIVNCSGAVGGIHSLFHGQLFQGLPFSVLSFHFMAV